MKNLLLMLCLFTIGCGSEEKNGLNEQITHEKKNYFLTKSKPREIFLSAITNNTYIDANQTEDCLSSDRAQTLDNEFCLLSWGTNTRVENHDLDKLVSQYSASSINIMMLAIARKWPIRYLDLSDIEKRIIILKERPSWIKLLLIRNWLELQTNISTPTYLYFRKLISSFVLQHPRDHREMYELARVLYKQYHSPDSKNYCTDTNSPVLKTRCLRYISALPEYVIREDISINRFLSLMNKIDLSYFKASFPSRWLILLRNRGSIW
ncbi:MAG: hypothetical protein M9962_10735 [Oligoflexia bacterium]|nr:hypothetical protein [Oligoflexia bacterium]